MLLLTHTHIYKLTYISISLSAIEYISLLTESAIYIIVKFGTNLCCNKRCMIINIKEHLLCISNFYVQNYSTLRGPLSCLPMSHE